MKTWICKHHLLTYFGFIFLQPVAPNRGWSLVRFLRALTLTISEVLLDSSTDAGVDANTSHPTPHDNPMYIEVNLIHFCIPNLSRVVRTATYAFLNAAWPFIEQIARRVVGEAIATDPVLASRVDTK